MEWSRSVEWNGAVVKNGTESSVLSEGGMALKSVYTHMHTYILPYI